ncbi:Glycolate permease GlcA [Gemmata obscuriglobus]|uniref:L-lactate permease n=1 Tax=Gemmata obscuriglobus TaxID=114 RepID=A0A2Z3HE39_9BACT|nr:L-lactate permease [Gemmata obscuriglobus]AWM41225.1 L-lactate permease [Gemmata obscuriglobus]QEG25433.1 Glycolate permease GlcA [Gemmata obscuriglobus]VTR98564.1 lactate permease family transporter : L-lactate permease OS=Burkholderia glathei GN=BG61_19765 PE=4 SV=1: Lactate_perm [Gemmata obscuriglobus UQM 2246]
MPLAYVQNLDPLGFKVLSTVVAALPVLVLFYLLVGRRWLASWAGAAGAVFAILLAWLVYRMPLGMAGASFVYGAAFGLLPIGWTVFAAMLLYNVTVETGQFTVIRRSIGGLSRDARVQAVLIGFAFGAFMEGAAGAGSPVAICGAMLVGLGVPPFRAAVICLIANTSPVCYGGLGVPIMTLETSSGVSADKISIMCGHQLPLLSCLIPFYMVKCMCTWRQTFAIWPALAVGGGSFAAFQFFFSTAHAYGLPPIWQLTDIGGGLFSLLTLALFLKFVWRPRDEWRFPEEAPAPVPAAQKPHDPQAEHAKEEVAALLDAPKTPEAEKPLTAGLVAWAWMPWLLMALCLVVSGYIKHLEKQKGAALDLGGIQSYYDVEIPGLHKQVERAKELIPPNTPDEKKLEAAVFKFTWLTAPGTPVLTAALLSMLLLKMSGFQVITVFRKTVHQMRIPIPTIAFMLGLSYVTKYAGMDATLGVAFAATGVLYPFFAAMLGWLGVFLTGTDAGSNALFGGLQKITATEVWTAHSAGAMSNLTLEQAQTLICTANSTGGVMGKMIDAQSICVATAGTNQVGKEADLFKAVIWHSILLASIVGLLTALQAFLPPFTLMVPK